MDTSVEKLKETPTCSCTDSSQPVFHVNHGNRYGDRTTESLLPESKSLSSIGCDSAHCQSLSRTIAIGQGVRM